jgi:beta-lactam-binding protein with PASTA domain
MKFRLPFSGDTLGSVLANLALAVVIVLVLSVAYFYVYLPGTTNHGDEFPLPDLIGMDLTEAQGILAEHHLRYEIGDSSYSENHAPLTILQQFPKAGHGVKENRKVYISINRKTPPTLPVPNLLEAGSGSLANAEAVLRSNELRRGRILYQHSPFRDLIIEMRMNGKVIEPGSRVPKGSVIDLVVGDGGGPKDFLISNFVGLPYENARLRLANLSLHLVIQIPKDVDTTGIDLFVLKQSPAAGDSVSIGDPVNFWIGPKGKKISDEEEEENH